MYIYICNSYSCIVKSKLSVVLDIILWTVCISVFYSAWSWVRISAQGPFVLSENSQVFLQSLHATVAL